MVNGSIHSFSFFVHMLPKWKHRLEQGFSSLSTTNTAGYYDYLYIYRSNYETNLSLNWGKQ